VGHGAIRHRQRFPQLDRIDAQALGIALRDADSGDKTLTALAQGCDFFIPVVQSIGLGSLWRWARLGSLFLFLRCRNNFDIQAVLFESLAVEASLLRDRQNIQWRNGRGFGHGCDEIASHDLSHFVFHRWARHV
jgi:hypothetical protein